MTCLLLKDILVSIPDNRSLTRTPPSVLWRIIAFSPLCFPPWMQMQLNITSSIENGKSSEDGLTFGSRNHSVISSSINMSERERNHKRVNTSSEFRCIFIVHFEYLLAPCFKAKPLSKSPEIVARWTKFSSVSNAIQC